jgi:hypothetical protein
MKQLQIVFLVAISLITTTVQAKPETPTTPHEKEQITELVKTLALLTGKADACGEHMNYFGKKALEGEVCKEFKKGFFDRWPSRDALQQLIADYTYRLDHREFTCENCDVMLQRAEELRITITYYLDYMDFVKEF